MDSQVKPFYSNTNVLITGATGLFGKLLIYKLSYTCDDMNGIYLIIREKKGNSVTDRLEEVLADPVFDKLKAEKPEFLKKIHVLAGDCSRPELGLSQTNRKLLIEKINVVFHCAALLNMDAKMKDAVDTNIRGLSDMIDLCHEMRNLKSMVFVSTAYSNCTQYLIEERFYDVPIQATTLIKLTEEIDEGLLDNITSGLIDKWPNTYCYTKAVAENVFCNNARDLPVGLFRPSIVMPTYSDPVPGWTSNIYGPVGVMTAAGLGILRVFFAEPHKKFDFVPADLCVNALICSAWRVSQQRENSENCAEQQIPVFNYSGGPKRNLTWSELIKGTIGYEYPLKNAVWVTSLILTSSPFYYNLLWFFLHTIPGYLSDIYLMMTGQKSRLIKAYKKISKFSHVLAFFTTNEWNIVNKNVDHLWNRLNETDKGLFPFDMNAMDYKKYIKDTCLGIKLYILKENLDNAEAEKQRYQRLLRIHSTIKAGLQVLLLVILYKLISLIMSQVGG